MDTTNPVLNIARDMLKKRRYALECAKFFEEFLRDISKTYHLNLDFSNDTVTEEVVESERRKTG